MKPFSCSLQSNWRCPKIDYSELKFPKKRFFFASCSLNLYLVIEELLPSRMCQLNYQGFAASKVRKPHKMMYNGYNGCEL